MGSRCLSYWEVTMKTKLWFSNHLDFLRPLRTGGAEINELTRLFNQHFYTEYTKTQILNCCIKNGIKSGRSGQFKKGLIPWHAGKKGAIKSRLKPDGATRIDKSGYVLIKADGGNRNFRPKNRVIWEQHNGAIPKGHVIVFADQDNNNFDIDNLICVPRRDLAILNKKEKISTRAKEVRPLIVKIVKMEGMAR